MTTAGDSRSRGTSQAGGPAESQPVCSRGCPATPEVGPCGMGMVPSWFTRSAVYRKVPASVRCRLDAAILLRPPGCETLEAINSKYKLSVRYGVSLRALGRYARNLERLVRPAVASQVMAGVLGCLPAHFRRRLFDGSLVLLLSRVNQVLNDEEGPRLSVSELAKLADVLKDLAHCRSDPAGRPSRRGAKGGRAARAGEADPSKLAEAVRALYGLSWPPQEDRDGSHDREAG